MHKFQPPAAWDKQIHLCWCRGNPLPLELDTVNWLRFLKSFKILNSLWQIEILAYLICQKETGQRTSITCKTSGSRLQAVANGKKKPGLCMLMEMIVFL
jgi:hypothetical protein